VACHRLVDKDNKVIGFVCGPSYHYLIIKGKRIYFTHDWGPQFFHDREYSREVKRPTKAMYLAFEKWRDRREGKPKPPKGGISLDNIDVQAEME